MRGRLTTLRESIRNGFWAVPGMCVLLAIVLSQLLVFLDRHLQAELAFTFGAGPDGAREVLSAITTAMITFTGLVFSITVVVLQLTSSQFSPRVLRTFLRDRLTQYAMGTFTATFVYAVMVLRTVDGGDDSEFVPAVSTTVALGLLIVSVALFVAYIHHIATSMQASSIVAAIGTETRRTVDDRFPAGHPEPVDLPTSLPPDRPATAVLPAQRPGVVTTFDEDRLVALARDADVVLRTEVRPGDFLPEGAPLFEVLGASDALDAGEVLDAVRQNQDRTMQQDVAFGFRQLADVAERALSPSTNDPTTAVQVLDQLHDLLRRLATRPLRTGVLCDEDGQVRVVMPPSRFEDYLTLALEGIDQWGREHRPVQERIDELLADLCAAAIPRHRDAVERYAEQRRATH
jgi:uncharacterized membrane protein